MNQGKPRLSESACEARLLMLWLFVGLRTGEQEAVRRDSNAFEVHGVVFLHDFGKLHGELFHKQKKPLSGNSGR